MRAVRFARTGGPEVLSLDDVPVPEPGPGEALVRLKAAGINHLDVWLRTGALPAPLPHIPGSDGAGEVAAVGPGVTEVREGERCLIAPMRFCGRCAACLSGAQQLCEGFAIFGTDAPGTCAEYTVAPARSLLPLADGIPFTDAAATPVAGLTAWHTLVTRARLAPGETALIHSAGSGLGSFAVQVARLAGARVLATVGDRAKVEKAEALGAEVIVRSEHTDLAAEVRARTGGRGADVVLDHVGAWLFAANLASLARGGRLVVCGTTTGGDVAFNLRTLFGPQQSILGARLGSLGELVRLMDLVAAGTIRPVVDTVFPLAEAAAAHARMEGRAVFGKLVLEVP
jgi:NADPH:quinone reductase-like Zn-dependent oxidoreductase